MCLDTSVYRVGQHNEWESIMWIESNVDISRNNKSSYNVLPICVLLIKCPNSNQPYNYFIPSFLLFSWYNFRMQSFLNYNAFLQWIIIEKNTVTLCKGVLILLFKVWDAVDTGCCLKTFSCHSCAVRAARWSSCGRRILSGGFDSMLHLTDVETGKGHEECIIVISLLCTEDLGSC